MALYFTVRYWDDRVHAFDLHTVKITFFNPFRAQDFVLDLTAWQKLKPCPYSRIQSLVQICTYMLQSMHCNKLETGDAWLPRSYKNTSSLDRTWSKLQIRIQKRLITTLACAASRLCVQSDQNLNCGNRLLVAFVVHMHAWCVHQQLTRKGTACMHKETIRSVELALQLVACMHVKTCMIIFTTCIDWDLWAVGVLVEITHACPCIVSRIHRILNLRKDAYFTCTLNLGLWWHSLSTYYE